MATSPNPDNNIPKGLRENLFSDRLILFVGSGLSRRAGAPDWRGLLRLLITRCHEELIEVPNEQELEELVDGSSTELLIAADYLRSVLNEKMAEFIHAAFYGLSPQPVHQIIAQLPLAGVVTTNYDSLIEEAYRKLGVIPQVILPRDVYSLARLEDKKPWILKIHGTVEAPSDIVLSTADYEQLAHDPATAGTLSRLFQQYTCLFVGFGLNDPDTLELLSQIRAAFGSRNKRHYALVEDSSIGRIKEKYLLESFQIQAVKYVASSDSHPEVEDFVRRLLRSYEEAHEIKMQKILLLITRNGRWPMGDVEKLLLVTNTNPQWRVGERTLSGNFDQRAYLLPSITGISNDIDTLRLTCANLIGVAPSDLTVSVDTIPFENTKYNPAVGKNTCYTFSFATIELFTTPDHIQEAVVPLGGRWYEWQSLMGLRSHPATMALNGDVLIEISRRYGPRLEQLSASVGTPLEIQADPYEFRARQYETLSWVKDRSLLDKIVNIAETENAMGVLDLGCGPGVLGQVVSERLNLNYVGVDTSFEMVARAREILARISRVRIERLDIASDYSSERFDGWCFVIKNMLHLLPRLKGTLMTLTERFGQPTSLIILETVSPNVECLGWIQTLFEVVGVYWKRNWFVKGQIPFLVDLWGATVIKTETIEQYIELEPWLNSFPLEGRNRPGVRRLIDGMPSEVRRDLKYQRLPNGTEQLLRLQELTHIRFPTS